MAAATSLASEFFRVPAFLAILSSFLVHFVVLGQQFSWGIYQAHYLSTFLSDSSPFAVSFIGTLSAALKLTGGVVASRLVDGYTIPGTKIHIRLSYRGLILFTTIPLTLGYWLSSYVPDAHLSTNSKLALLIFTQSFLPGISWSLSIFPAMTIPSKWFIHNRGVAQGIAASGGGIGAFVLCPLTQHMIDHFGLEWALRGTGIMSFAFLTLAAICTRVPEVTPGEEGDDKSKASTASATNQKQLIAPNSPTDKYDFPMLTLGAFVGTFGYIVPSHFGPSFAVDVLRLPKDEAAFTIGLMNIMTAVGRLIFGWASDIVGHLNVYSFSFTGDALLILFAWTASSAVAIQGNLEMAHKLWYFFVIGEGLLMGAVITLGPVVLADLFGGGARDAKLVENGNAQISDVESLSSSKVHVEDEQEESQQGDTLLRYVSKLYIFQSIPALLNSPIAGAILSASGAVYVMSSTTQVPNYLYIILYSGISLFVGSMGPLIVRLRRGRWRRKKWDGGWNN